MAENMFIGKSALLGWLNNTLQLKLEKIEDVSFQLSIDRQLFYELLFTC